LDRHVIDKIDESAALYKKSPNYVPVSNPVVEESAIDVLRHYPNELLPLSRAALYGCVVSLSQGRYGVRSSVVQMIIQLLEYEIVPCIQSIKSFGINLVHLLTNSSTYCYYYKNIHTAEVAYLSSGLSPIDLTVHEVSVLEHGHFYYTGIASLLANLTNNSFKMLDIISAFSIETIGMPIDMFDAQQFELYRPHRGMMTSAANIRHMLNGSERVGISKDFSPSSFTAIPNHHGPAQEYLTNATKYVFSQ
jgi:histidine ammonia-lyase